MSHKSNNFQQVNFWSAFTYSHIKPEARRAQAHCWFLLHSFRYHSVHHSHSAKRHCKQWTCSNQQMLHHLQAYRQLSCLPQKKVYEDLLLSDNECLLFVCGCCITLYYLHRYNSHLGHTTTQRYHHHHFHYIFNWICIDMAWLCFVWLGLARLGSAWLGFGTYVCSQWMFNDPTNLYE